MYHSILALVGVRAPGPQELASPPPMVDKVWQAPKEPNPLMPTKRLGNKGPVTTIWITSSSRAAAQSENDEELQRGSESF